MVVRGKIRGSEILAYGYIQGRCTVCCVTTFLANDKAKYSLFLDLKDAFDRANRQIILHLLAEMGIKGKLLAWIKDYLTDRKVYFLFQAERSSERELELGTPQGGVLSPTLFNILMNAILNTKLPKGVTTVIYTDEILIEAETYRHYTRLQLFWLILYQHLRSHHSTTVQCSRLFSVSAAIID